MLLRMTWLLWLCFAFDVVGTTAAAASSSSSSPPASQPTSTSTSSSSTTTSTSTLSNAEIKRFDLSSSLSFSDVLSECSNYELFKTASFVPQHYFDADYNLHLSTRVQPVCIHTLTFCQKAKPKVALLDAVAYEHAANMYNSALALYRDQQMQNAIGSIIASVELRRN